VTSVTAIPESLGEQYDPLGVHMADPYPFYTHARRSAPIFFSPRLDAWVVTRMADVKKVLRDGKTFSSVNSLRPFAPLSPSVYEVLATGYPQVYTMIQLDGEAHQHWRGPSATSFSAERVNAAEPYITERANALVDGFAAGGTIDFMTAYANPLAVSVICHLMGYSADQHELIGDDGHRAASLTMGHQFLSDDEQTEAANSWVRFQRVIGEHVRDRRAAPQADLMSEMIAAYVPGDGPLTPQQEAELVGHFFGTTLAGHITTSALLGNGLIRLLSHPDQWRLLCEQPALIPNAVEEIARFDTPTHIFLRRTTTETTVAGQRLPEGAEVAVWLAAANRDETFFDRAEEFDITRTTPRNHVVFGHGVHFCVGAALARREIEISLRVLTRRLPSLRLVPEQQITYRPTLDHRGPISLHLTWS
jgi:cytochrome P450